MKKYSHFLPPSVKYVVLTVSCGKTWSVRKQMMDTNEYYFKGQGWRKFVLDNNIEKHDMLHFSFITESVMRVTAYDVSGYEKPGFGANVVAVTEIERDGYVDAEKKLNNQHERNIEVVKVYDSDGIDEMIDNNHAKPKNDGDDGIDDEHVDNQMYEADNIGEIKLEKTMTLSNKSRVTIPVEFANASGFTETTDISVVYGVQQSDVITLYVRGNYGTKRFELSTGWPAFFTKHKMVVGYMYSFEYNVNTNVIRVYLVHDVVDDN
ncbi:hypothetical protein ACP275_13G049300 [Erythranthe tilingii]